MVSFLLWIEMHALNRRLPIGLIYLRPHPNRNGLVCVLSGTDEAGLELAARLVPVRTGVPIPEWAVIGPLSRYQGAVGILAAG